MYFAGFNMLTNKSMCRSRVVLSCDIFTQLWLACLKADTGHLFLVYTPLLDIQVHVLLFQVVERARPTVKLIISPFNNLY